MKKSSLVFLLLILSIALYSCAKVTSTSSSSERTITGTVIDWFSGKPLAGARVLAGSKSTLTDSTGKFTLNDAPLTPETVTVVAPGYTPMTVAITANSMTLDVMVMTDYYTTGTDNTLVSAECRDEAGDKANSMNSYIVWYKFNEGGFPLNSNKDISQKFYADPGLGSTVAAYLIGSGTRAVTGALLYGTKQISFAPGGITNVGTFDVSPDNARIQGTVTGPAGFTPSSVTFGLMDGTGRWGSRSGDLWSASAAAGTYTLRVPPTPTGMKYYIRAYGYQSSSSIALYAYVNDIAVSAGDVNNNDLTLPSPIATTSPTNGAGSVGLSPTLTWVASSEFNMYMVLVTENTSGTIYKWAGVTTGNSITYPNFAAGSGGEGVNLVAGRSYEWTVYGYYIPSYTLASIKPDALLKARSLKAMAEGGGVKMQVISETGGALRESMSSANWFSP